MAKKNQHSRRSVPTLAPRMIIFLVGFVLCTIIGSFLRGPVEQPDYVSDRYIFWITRDIRTFFYEGVALFLGRAVGLPIAGETGRIFTLISSVFFFVMAVSLYGAWSGTEIADFGDEPESGVSRAIHFIASYAYLAPMSYIMMDSSYGGAVRNSPGYYNVILLFFLITVPVTIYNHSDDEMPVRQKYPARWLASLCVALSAAGFGRLIMDSGLAVKFHAPTLAWSVIAPMTQNIPATLGGIGKVLLILAVPTAVLAICAACLLNEKRCLLPFSIVSFTLLVGGGLMFYAVRGTDGAELRSVATWILLLFGVVIWAMAAPQGKVLTFAAGLGVLFSGSALVVGIRLLRPPFNAAIDALRPALQPLQDQALSWLTGIIPNQFWGLILMLVACLLVNTLLSMPVTLSKRIPKLFSIPLDRVKLCYFAAIVLFFMESDHEIFRGIAFILLLLSLVGMAAMLGAAIAVRRMRAVISILYTAACMALLTIPFALFAVQFAWIIFGVIISMNFIGMAKALKSAGSGMAKAQNQAAHANASAAIHDAVMAGGDSYSLGYLQDSVNRAFGIDRSIWDDF